MSGVGRFHLSKQNALSFVQAKSGRIVSATPLSRVAKIKAENSENKNSALSLITTQESKIELEKVTTFRQGESKPPLSKFSKYQQVCYSFPLQFMSVKNSQNETKR